LSEDSIAKGLKARAQARSAQGRGGGGASSGPGPQTFGTNFGQGGVASQYNEWSFGISYGTGLDRPWSDFLSGAFGPLAPIQPLGIDTPQTESGRPEPRRMQYPVGWNMPMGQPGSEGLKLVSFANLRAYADMYSVVRACIQVRKEEIMGLDWDIVPTDEAARAMRGDEDAHSDFQERRAEALKFFKRPDPNYHDFQGWLSAVLEDVFVVDALALYLHPSRLPGKGLFKSDLAAIEVLDGTTIRPLLDVRGGTPRPPSVAYQQYLWGVPRTDLMDIILEADIEEMGEPVDEYRADQLLYLPYTRRSWTPYGFPGIERAIIPVMTGLRRQQFQLDFFSEGSIPGQFVVPGDDISTPQQIRQLQDTLNALAGDQAYKHKIIVLPRGSSAQPQKPIDLAGKIDEILLNMICMAYDVMPMELGMSPSVSASQSSGAASQMAKASQEINQRKALKPMLSWLKGAIFDHILQDVCSQDDMQFVWIGLEDTQDEETMANNFKTLISSGLMSIDEARAQMGMSPWGLPLTSDPIYMSATGVSTLGAIAPNIADSDLNDPIADNNALQTAPTSIGGAAGAPPAAPTSAPTTPQPATSAGTPGVGGRPRGGGGGAPQITQPAAGTSTPLHGASGKKTQQKAVDKAIQSEFESLRRFLKKGRSIDKWTPEFIPSSTFTSLKKSLSQGVELGAAITKAKNNAKVQAHVARRDAAIASVSSSVEGDLNDLASQINDPNVGMIGFVDRGTKILQQGYHAIYNAATRDAAANYDNVSRVIPQDVAILAAQRAEKQRDFLTGFAQDIKSNVSNAKKKQRIALYARSLQPAYEEGHGLAVLSGQALGNSTNSNDNKYIDMHAGPAFSSDYLPAGTGVNDYSELSPMYDESAGMDSSNITDGSGDGMSSLLAFAGMVGIGLLAGAIGADQTDENGVMTAPEDGNYDSPPAQVIIWHATDDEACDLCADRDGEEYTLDTLPCWPGDGGFGEFCDGAANCRCTLEYVNGDDSTLADNPFSSDSVDFYAQRLAEENAYDQAAIDARAADIANVALTSPDAAARMQMNDMLYGVPNTRQSYRAGAEAVITKSENNLTDVVWNYLKQHYKKSAIRWAKEATWTFNPDMPIDDLILMRPTNTIDQDKVAQIEDEIRQGEPIAPIVLVKTSEGYDVADGNHRVTAMRNVGIKTTTAYIATGVGDAGPWATMMQNNQLKKFANVEIAKSVIEMSAFMAYKSLSADAMSVIQVGDIISDDEPVTFSSTRPESAYVAVVKYLPTGRLLPGQELIVTSVSDNEVVLEIL